MPRQNRVNPFGEIVAINDRGMFMGNRGRLHDDQAVIRRSWNGRRWILCRLEFKGRKRPLMAPNRYTELFFLDEAIGFAAGHRPCCECRRLDYQRFVNAWPHPQRDADSIDLRLHNERIGEDRRQRTFAAPLDLLPDGVLITLPERERQPYLVVADRLLKWSPGGYLDGRTRPEGVTVSVLTPKSIVQVIEAGYSPQIHPSASSFVE